MGLQHSTERGKRMDYEGDEYDSTRIRKDIEEDNDMIARTLVISVKKSPVKRKTSPKKSPMKRKTSSKKSPVKRKTSPKKSPMKRKTSTKKSPVRRKTSPKKKKMNTKK